jgi:hypothetical protein
MLDTEFETFQDLVSATERIATALESLVKILEKREETQ